MSEKGTHPTGPLKIIPNSYDSSPTNEIDLCKSGSTRSAPINNLVIKGANNAATANVVTWTNASHGQATVVTQPDPGSATANFNVSPAALVNGNLISASGTAGLTQDSGVSSSSVSSLITQVGTVTSVAVTLNTAAVTGAYAAPALLVAAPGAGKTIVVQECAVYTASTGNTAYATGTAPIVQYGNTAHGAGTNALNTGLVAGDITASASQIRQLNNSVAALTGVTNAGLYFSNATGAYTAGTGTNITFFITYQVITATV